MILGFLLDENLPKWWRSDLNRRLPDLAIWHIGDPNAPPRGATDPDVLDWCESHQFALLTNNRSSMPRHLADRVANDKHMPGVFIVDPARNIEDLADELGLIAGGSLPGEYQDLIRYLPVI